MARTAKQTRPQLVCVLADSSGSMSGAKAQAATNGIREMLMACQSRGPAGPDRSYFKLLLVRFGDRAVLDTECDMTPVRMIDPDSITIEGDGGGTNITDALQVTLDRLRPYMKSLELHPERAEHPLPIVILFSDGEHNQEGIPPQVVADAIKKLSLDSDPVVIVVAGVAIGGGQPPDEMALRAIASTECYIPITNADLLDRFIASVGSSGASGANEIRKIIKTVTE